MLKSNAPAIITVPFASGAGAGYIRPVPIPSQISITPGAASWTDGFPPLTMTPSGAGGIPPFGQDMNGLLNAETLNMQWKQLGFDYAWSSSVSTAIGGYPSGARLLRSDGLGYWLNLADSNTTNPDATGATNWVAQRVNGGQSTIVVSSGTYTPDPSVLGVPLLVLSGTLTANVTVVLPLTRSGATWRIYNATTGAFTVNVQGATGSGVTASQGQLTDVTTDGTNYYSAGLSGGPYLPLSGTAVAAAKLASARTIAMTGPVTWSVSFDGSANVTAAATIAAGAVTLANLANLTASTLLGNPTTSAATPVAIPLVNGIVFSGGSLGLGNITPTSVSTGGTGNGATIAATGVTTIDTSAAGQQGLVIKNTFAAGNGAQINLIGNGATTPSKVIRVLNGNLQVVNDANTAIIATLTDAGAFTCTSALTFNGIANSSTTTCILAPNGAGAVYLRPNGSASSAGQVVVSNDGSVTMAGAGSVGIGTSANAVPGIGNPVIGANNIIAYNAGNIGLVLCTDNGAARTSQIGFASQGISVFAAGLQYNNSANALYVVSGGGVKATFPSGGGMSMPGIVSAGGGLDTLNGGTQGVQIMWNFVASGSGRNEYINDFGGGSGGHFFYSRSSSTGPVSNNFFIDANGNLTSYGTSSNFNTSDERVKTNFVEREPACMHHLWFGDYDRTDIVSHGVGNLAQDIRSVMPHRVREDEAVTIPGTDDKMLVMEQAGVALEQGIWCGREIDKLWAALKQAGIERVH